MLTANSKDPTSWNRYAYAGSDPVNNFDPQGTCWATVTSAAGTSSEWFDCAVDLSSIGGVAGFGSASARSSYVPMDPLPLTGSQKVAMISTLRGLVKSGKETDCDALTDYVDAVAEGLQGTKNAAQQLKAALGLLTPNHFPVYLIPGVNGNGAYQAINDGSSPSGFQTQFQDQIPNADQVHHFAAFFQLGFVYGGDAASTFAAVWEGMEGTLTNTGDIYLGGAAATLGANVASGVLPVGEVGNAIRENLCKH